MPAQVSRAGDNGTRRRSELVIGDVVKSQGDDRVIVDVVMEVLARLRVWL